jgi:hypothetical protein
MWMSRKNGGGRDRMSRLNRGDFWTDRDFPNLICLLGEGIEGFVICFRKNGVDGRWSARTLPSRSFFPDRDSSYHGEVAMASNRLNQWFPNCAPWCPRGTAGTF